MIFLLLLFLSCTLIASENKHIPTNEWEKSPYMNTNFLRNSSQVRTALLEKGFQEGDLQTEDKVLIHYLWKKRPNARVTLICCAGFFPGTKEGVASLYAMAPEDTNILLFDARGHGQSGGSYKKIWQYGLNEYKDIVSAIEFAHTQDSCPIVVWGICSGAFNAAHALYHLAQNKLIEQYKVTGFIFDSGWASYLKVSHSAPISEINMRAQWLITQLLGKNYASSTLTNGSDTITRLLISLIHRWVYTPLITQYESTTNLYEKIQHIPIPIWYIHSNDDSYVDITEVRKLANKTPHPIEWWIQEKSKHACHHLKHKKAYRTKLFDFFNRVAYQEKIN